ncbi:hypothetical protein ACFX15_021782 [Malus domestica]
MQFLQMKRLILLRSCNQHQIQLLYHGKVERFLEFLILVGMLGYTVTTGFAMGFTLEVGQAMCYINP